MTFRVVCVLRHSNKVKICVAGERVLNVLQQIVVTGARSWEEESDAELTHLTLQLKAVWVTVQLPLDDSLIE